MMGTQIMTDSTTPLDEDNLNKYCAGDGTTGTSTKGHAIWGLYIEYTGAAWAAHANYGAREQVSNVGLSWDGVNYRLDIDLSGCDNTFTSYPVVVCTPYPTNSAMWPKAYAVNASSVRVKFYDATSLAEETAESANMKFNILFFGEI